VVNSVQRMVRPRKTGHAGTLDPLADGVLLTCVGAATRLVPYLQQMQKCYRAGFRLGCTSNTDDIEGEINELPDAVAPTLDELQRVTEAMVGTIEQRPPAFSALKLNGRRAYKLAREGKKVELQPRPVVIHSLEIIRYAYPSLELDITCGSGTYVRAIGRDVAASVANGAVMTSLTRTAIGHFRAEDGLELENLDPASLDQNLLPMVLAVADLNQVELIGSEIEHLRHGMPIENRWPVHDDEFAGISGDGRLVAILTGSGDDQIRPLRNFPD